MPDVVYIRERKSVLLAVLLAAIFGPLGMLYATVIGALVMLLVWGVVGFLTAGLGLPLPWIVGVVWAGLAASKRGKV